MSKLEEMVWATEIKLDDDRKPIKGCFPTSTSKYVAAALARRTWIHGNREWSQQRIAEDTGLSARTIWTALKDLEGVKIIKRQKVYINNLRRADRLIFTLKSVRLVLEPEDQSGIYEDHFSLADIATDASQGLRGDRPADSARQDTGTGSKNKRDAGARFVPKDWSPNDSHRVKATTMGFTPEEFADLVEGIRCHEYDKPKTDFDLAFHTWIRNAAKFKKERHDRRPASSAPGRPTQRDENLASVQRGFMAALDQREDEGGVRPEDDYPI